jgi:RNA-directed DNA polymerase
LKKMNTAPIFRLPALDAQFYLLSSSSYSSIEWPEYFNFQRILSALGEKVEGPLESKFNHHRLLANKDGRHGWRPLTLLHPVSYVAAVKELTKDETWSEIQTLFESFARDPRIIASGIEQVELGSKMTKDNAMIYTWWRQTEQRTIELALDYDYMIQTDITDCYGSIRPHHFRQCFETLSNSDRLFRAVTGLFEVDGFEGLPQGNRMSDLLAELVLGKLDSEFSQRLSSINAVQILRFRDDYRIFARSSASAHELLKLLNLFLAEYGFRLNPSKTKGTDTIILDGMKPDKAFWIANKRLEEDRVKWLTQIHLVALEFPQSGTLVTELKEFLQRLPEFTGKVEVNRSRVPAMCSILTEIAFDNPRVVPDCITIISRLLCSFYPDAEERKKWAGKVVDKLMRIAHNSIHQLWCQRLMLSVGVESHQFQEAMCGLSEEGTLKSIFNVDDLEIQLAEIIRHVKVLDNFENSLGKPISNEELANVRYLQPYSFGPDAFHDFSG